LSSIVLSSALRGTLASLNSTERIIDVITERLASGLSVSSALDQPQNFFAARTLKNSASDYSRLLDDIGQSTRAIETAFTGLNSIEKLIEQGEVIAEKSRDFLLAGETDPAIIEESIDSSPAPLSTQILSLSPDVYYRLNETAGPIVDSGSGGAGPVGATYTNGATPNATALYTNGASPSVQFDGVDDRISVDDSTLINTQTTAQRTVELVFNADNTAGRQVLYEEGATLNGLTIYIDNGSLYVTAEDDNGVNTYADININAPIVAGQTYIASFVLDAPANTFSGYLDGQLIGSVTLAGDAVFPTHSGNIGIGGVSQGAQFHDGETGVANGFNFAGRISDVAIYNQALTSSQLLDHANALNSSNTTLYLNLDYENVIAQIDQIASDANYRGINLLQGENLITDFNPDRNNTLETQGQDLTVNGLGLERYDFNDLNDVNKILDSLDVAKKIVRSFGSTLSTDISILQTRLDFTKQTINTYSSGADDLTVSDQNKDGAEFLATQTRQSLGITSLNLAARSQASILRLF